MGHQRTVSAETQKVRQGLSDLGCALQHGVGDARQLNDLRIQLSLRVNEGLEGIHHLTAPQNDRADLRDGVVESGKARRLQVEGDEFPLQVHIAPAVDGDAVIHVVDVVALAAVEDFYGLVRPRHLVFAGLEGIREGGRHAVIRNGDGLVAPAGRRRHSLAGLGQGVHEGHGGMQMQLHPLLLRRVLTQRRVHALDGSGPDHHLPVVLVVVHVTLHPQPHARLGDGFGDGFAGIALEIVADADGTAKVRHIEFYDGGRALVDLPVGHGDDLALNDDPLVLVVLGDLSHGHGIALEGSAQDHGHFLFLFRR